jgi:hypothetical protein
MAEHPIDTRVDPRTAALCTARKRGSGEPCRAIAVTGKTKCRFHGGLSLSGAANGNYKHGRYSKDLLTQTAARAEEARTNPQLLSLSDDIALIEARIAEVLQGMGTGESGESWRELRGALDAFSRAMASGDMAAMSTHFHAMRTLVLQGADQAKAWAEVRRLEETRCKLIQTEVKTLQGLQQMITLQQHMLMVGAQTDAMIRAVLAHADTETGRKILRDMQAEFERLSTLKEAP